MKKFSLVAAFMAVAVFSGCDNNSTPALEKAQEQKSGAANVFAPLPGSSKSTKYEPLIKDVPGAKEKADSGKK